ncbi:MAG: hypothetical protein HZB26_06470 [Candidatus Hydrogenedentes bacterium]|nr:hypothetical protein [Candidatus Hydrogenedentota bacterium]
MRTRTAGSVLVTTVTVCAVLGVLVLGGVFWGIHQSVAKYSAVAQDAHPHPSDDIAALTDFVGASEHGLPQRNHAVWTLGRLSDPRALSVLEANYTGELCDHNTMLCQDELEKAIKRCGGKPAPRQTRR